MDFPSFLLVFLVVASIAGISAGVKSHWSKRQRRVDSRRAVRLQSMTDVWQMMQRPNWQDDTTWAELFKALEIMSMTLHGLILIQRLEQDRKRDDGR